MMEFKSHLTKRVLIRNRIRARASEKERDYHQKSKFCRCCIIGSPKKNFSYFTILSKINSVPGTDLIWNTIPGLV